MKLFNKLFKKVEEDNEQELKRFNIVWLMRKSAELGQPINDNETVVNNILNKLNERDGYCPCGVIKEEFICPCMAVRATGKCKCGLFRNVSDVDPKECTTTAQIRR